MILDGKIVAAFHREKLENKLKDLATKGISIGLGILLVGDDKAAQMYAHFMEKTAIKAGFSVTVNHLKSEASQKEVEQAVLSFNNNPNIYGILPLMPMPKQINVDKVLGILDPHKDIDGLTPISIGLFNAGKGGFIPCTPRACLAILKYYKIPLEGKKVVVLGRSNVVGKPIANLLLGEHATVTICHTHTKNLANELGQADIVIAAAGKAHIVTADMLKEGATVIDVGINELSGKTVGDVDFNGALSKVGAITPVPGGVGSVTTTMMLEALCEAYDA